MPTTAELRTAYGYPRTGAVTSLTPKRQPAKPPPPPVTRPEPEVALPVGTVDAPPADA